MSMTCGCQVGPTGSIIQLCARHQEHEAHRTADLLALIETSAAVNVDHRRLVRELDIALNGEDNAASQASLSDIVAQVKDERWNLVRGAAAIPQFEFLLNSYWLKHFLAAPYCTLCGNTGIVDTSESAKDPHGNPVGVRTYCICPNGRVLRKHKGKIDPDTIIEARKKRSDE